jgi:hypothetical protein
MCIGWGGGECDIYVCRYPAFKLFVLQSNLARQTMFLCAWFVCRRRALWRFDADLVGTVQT